MNDLRFGVIEGEGGAPVSVAGLADRAGIDQVAGGRFQLQRYGFGGAYGFVFRTESIGGRTVGKKSALQVGVAEEGQGRIQGDERRQSITERDDVFIFVIGRAMHQLNIRMILQRDRPVRKIAQPLQVLSGQLLAGPEGGRRSHRVEVFKIHKSGCGLVVIAPDESLAQFTGTLGDFVRAGTVSDDIAEVDDQVVSRSGCEARIESFQIGVDITEQQYAHGAPDELPIIDRRSEIWRCQRLKPRIFGGGSGTPRRLPRYEIRP